MVTSHNNIMKDGRCGYAIKNSTINLIEHVQAYYIRLIYNIRHIIMYSMSFSVLSSFSHPADDRGLSFEAENDPLQTFVFSTVRLTCKLTPRIPSAMIGMVIEQ